MTPPASGSGQTERRFRAALSSLGLPTASPVIAGISGGPDSSALLLLLARSAGELGYQLEAAYFDHRIRPAGERAAELATVRRLTTSLGVRLWCGAAPVPLLADRAGRSLEEEARVQRYRFLAHVAEERGAEVVAVGHTADDQAETILLRILRGSGVRGLVGMTPEAGWPAGDGPRLVRPLLGLSRSDTEAYCRARGFEPHHDSSNASPSHARNRIRLELMPLLRRMNPRVEEALRRLGASAAESIAVIDRLAASLPEAVADQDGRALTLPLPLLAGLPDSLRSEFLARAYSRLTGSRRGLAFCHLTALTDLTLGKMERSLDLPGQVSARLTPAGLRLALGRRGDAAVPAAIVIPETRMSVPGLTRVAGWELEARTLSPGEPFPLPPLSACVAASQHQMAPVVRSRRAGDRFRPSGMEGSKKLQDLFVDARVPREQRDGVPIVCLDGEVVWVVGLRRSARADVRSLDLTRIGLAAHRLDSNPTPDYDGSNI